MRRQSLRCVYMVTGLVADVLGFSSTILKRLRKLQDRRQEYVP